MGAYFGALHRAIGIRRFVIGSAITVIIAFYAQLRSTLERIGIGLPDLPSWQLATLAALVLLLWFLLGRIVELEGAIEPRIQMDFGNWPPCEVTEPMTGTKPATRLIRVRVRNTGATNLTNCLVKLERIERFNRPDFRNAFVPVALKTQHQQMQQRTGGNFNLRAGEEKYVAVASLDERQTDTEIGLAYEHSDYPNLIPRGTYTLLLRAYGASKPTEKEFTLSVKEGRLSFSEKTSN